jgi:hypothetical protein
MHLKRLGLGYRAIVEQLDGNLLYSLSWTKDNRATYSLIVDASNSRAINSLVANSYFGITCLGKAHSYKGIKDIA